MMIELTVDGKKDNRDIWIRFTRPMDEFDGCHLLSKHPDGLYSTNLKKYPWYDKRNYAYMVKSKEKHRISKDQLEMLKLNKLQFEFVDPYE